MPSFATIAVFLMLAASPVAAQSPDPSGQDGAPGVSGQGGSTGASGLDDGSSELGLEQRVFELTSPTGAVIPALDLDPDGNGSIDADEREAVRRFSVEHRQCDGVILSTSSPEQIAAIMASSRVALVLVCADPSGLGQELRAAIAANSALMDRLGRAGYGLANVAGLELTPDGWGTLYVANF